MSKGKKDEPPPHLRLTSIEGIGYIAWAGDPLYALSQAVEELELAEEEVLLPLSVLLATDALGIDPTPILNDDRNRRQQIVRQLEEYGGKLTLQEVIDLIGRLRQLGQRDYLLEVLHGRRDTVPDEEGAAAAAGGSTGARRRMADPKSITARLGSNGAGPD